MHVFLVDDVAHELMSLGVRLDPGVNELAPGVGEAVLHVAREAAKADGVAKLDVRPATIVEVQAWADARKQSEPPPVVDEPAADAPVAPTTPPVGPDQATTHEPAARMQRRPAATGGKE